MKIIAVDIALRKSGIIVLDVKNRTIEFSTTLNVSNKLSRTDALLSIYDSFHSLFSKYKTEGNSFTLAMEDVMTYGHLKAAVAIESARTSATLAYHHSGRMDDCAPIIYATPGAVKQHFTGKRGAKKPELFQKFLIKYPEYENIKLTEDEMDALVLALYALETSCNN